MRLKLDAMRKSAGDAEEMLRALASRHRLMILCQLIDGERSVGEMAEFLELRDSTVSQHLAVLRRDGLVRPRREGQTIWYAIASAPARTLIETLYRVYCGPDAITGPAKKPGNKRAASTAR